VTCPCGRPHHKFRKILGLLHQKVRTSASEEPPLVRKMSALNKLPLPPDCGRLLWTAPYAEFKNYLEDVYCISIYKLISRT